MHNVMETSHELELQTAGVLYYLAKNKPFYTHYLVQFINTELIDSKSENIS